MKCNWKSCKNDNPPQDTKILVGYGDGTFAVDMLHKKRWFGCDGCCLLPVTWDYLPKKYQEEKGEWNSCVKDAPAGKFVLVQYDNNLMAVDMKSKDGEWYWATHGYDGIVKYWQYVNGA